MHEASLIANLVRQITALAHAHGARRVVGVHIKLGALCHIAPDHFRTHFVYGTRGTVAEGAQLTIERLTDTVSPLSQEVILDSIEVVEETSLARD